MKDDITTTGFGGPGRDKFAAVRSAFLVARPPKLLSLATTKVHFMTTLRWVLLFAALFAAACSHSLDQARFPICPGSKLEHLVAMKVAGESLFAAAELPNPDGKYRCYHFHRFMWVSTDSGGCWSDVPGYFGDSPSCVVDAFELEKELEIAAKENRKPLGN